MRVCFKKPRNEYSECNRRKLVPRLFLEVMIGDQNYFRANLCEVLAPLLTVLKSGLTDS